MPVSTVYIFGAFLAIAKVYAVTEKTETPALGWNSYNAHGCSPTEQIIQQNAQGLVDSGYADLGYEYVTVDCGWPTEERDEQGRLVWDPKLFPSGGKALGDYIHNLGLKFGLYSGAGYYQCGSGSRLASLGNETADAEAFDEWGGDSLKYDNYYYYPEADPSTRFRAMSDALDDVARPIVYQICQWGVGQNLGSWASEISDSWRISNDIGNNWDSIWRITNEVVPYYKHTGVGAYPDMDMLMVGLGGLSLEEERFHFGMWAINKSPLIFGSGTAPGSTANESVQILQNQEVIDLNQDPLGKQAQLIRRYTEEGYDIWAGNLSEGRKVVGIANWVNGTIDVPFDLVSVGVSSAGNARDIWAAEDLGPLSGTLNLTLASHELKLLVLSDIEAASTPTQLGYYNVTSAALEGNATIVGCGTNDCAPVGSKVISTGSTATVTFSNVDAGSTGGEKLLVVDYINYDIALDEGDNTLNMTVSVNGDTPKLWSFPISGGDPWETGSMTILVEGFFDGADNDVTFGGPEKGSAPELVGFTLTETQ